MNVYTTEKFNKLVGKLKPEEQQQVYRAFNLASEFDSEHLPTDVKVITSIGSRDLFEFRQKELRIYSTIENIRGNKSMILLGVEKAKPRRARSLAKLIKY